MFMLFQILSLLLVLLVTRVLWRRWKYDLHRVPSPPGLPLIGHTLEFVYGQPTHQLAQWLGNCLKQLGYPKLMKLDMNGSSWLFVTDMDFIKDVMMSRSDPFPRVTLVDAFAEPMFGRFAKAKSILTTAVMTPYLKATRKVYATAFQSGNLKIAVPKLNSVVQNVVEIIEARREDGPIDVQPLFVKMTLDSIGQVAFGKNLGGLDNSQEIYKLLMQAGYIIRSRFLNPIKTAYVRSCPWSKEGRKQNAVIDALIGEWEELTKEILKRDDPPSGEEPMWFALKNAKDPETNKPISYESLVCEVASVVLAGTDTTGHALGWIFGLLASHPHVVQKLLSELSEHGLYGVNSRSATFEDLGELTYLTAIIKEGMRVANVVDAGFSQMVPKDMTILGYRIPKGTVILWPGMRAMCSEEMWGDPEVFRPERWLSGEDMSQKYSMGFSVGPRDCVGQRLAMLEMRLTIIKLVTRYELKLEGSWEELNRSARDAFITEAKNGVWIHMNPRSKPVQASII